MNTTATAHKIYKQMQAEPVATLAALHDELKSSGQLYLELVLLTKMLRIARGEQKLSKQKLTTARELDTAIIDAIKSRYKISDDVSTEVDEGLIGGFKLETKDYVVQANIKNELAKMRTLLMN